MNNAILETCEEIIRWASRSWHSILLCSRLDAPLPVPVDIDFYVSGTLRSQEQVSDVYTALRLIPTASQGRVILVEAIAGAGKTVALRYSACRFAKDCLSGSSEPWLPIYLDLGQLHTDIKRKDLNAILEHHLGRRTPVNYRRVSNCSIPRIILVDGLDLIPEPQIAYELIRAAYDISATRPDRFVLSTRPSIDVWQVLQDYDDSVVVRLRSLTTETRRKRIGESWTSQAKARCRSIFGSSTQIETICETPLLFGLAELICHEAAPRARGFVTSTYAGTTRLIDSAIIAMTSRALAAGRLPPNTKFYESSRALEECCLACARRGNFDRIPLQELHNYLNDPLAFTTFRSPAESTHNWKLAKSVAFAAGILVEDDRNHEYRFPHQLFLEYLAGRALAKNLRLADGQGFLEAELCDIVEFRSMDSIVAVALEILCELRGNSGLVKTVFKLLLEIDSTKAYALAEHISSELLLELLEPRLHEVPSNMSAVHLVARSAVRSSVVQKYVKRAVSDSSGTPTLRRNLLEGLCLSQDAFSTRLLINEACRTSENDRASSEIMTTLLKEAAIRPRELMVPFLEGLLADSQIDLRCAVDAASALLKCDKSNTVAKSCLYGVLSRIISADGVKQNEDYSVGYRATMILAQLEPESNDVRVSTALLMYNTVGYWTEKLALAECWAEGESAFSAGLLIDLANHDEADPRTRNRAAHRFQKLRPGSRLALPVFKRILYGYQLERRERCIAGIEAALSDPANAIRLVKCILGMLHPETTECVDALATLKRIRPDSAEAGELICQFVRSRMREDYDSISDGSLLAALDRLGVVAWLKACSLNTTMEPELRCAALNELAHIGMNDDKTFCKGIYLDRANNNRIRQAAFELATDWGYSVDWGELRSLWQTRIEDPWVGSWSPFWVAHCDVELAVLGLVEMAQPLDFRTTEFLAKRVVAGDLSWARFLELIPKDDVQRNIFAGVTSAVGRRLFSWDRTQRLEGYRVRRQRLRLHADTLVGSVSNLIDNISGQMRIRELRRRRVSLRVERELFMEKYLATCEESGTRPSLRKAEEFSAVLGTRFARSTLGITRTWRQYQRMTRARHLPNAVR